MPADTASQVISFPNLGYDSTQVIMTALSFAAQADFFDRFSSGSGLTWIAQLFALIGFTYIGIFHTAWRAVVILPWFVLLLIMTLGTSYTGGNVFFVNVPVTSNQSLSAPPDLFQQYSAEEMLEIKENSEHPLHHLANRFPPPSKTIDKNDIDMFGPQVGILHALNLLHRDLANAMFAEGNRTLVSRFASAQALGAIRTRDFRVAHIQAAFRASCPSDDQSMFAVPPKVLQEDHADVYRNWTQEKITYGDFIAMHSLFYANQNRLAEFVDPEDEGTFSRFVSPPFLTDSASHEVSKKAIGLQLSNKLTGGQFAGVGNIIRADGPVIGLYEYAGFGEYRYGSDAGTSANQFMQFADSERRAEKETHFNQVLLPGVGAQGSATDALLDQPVQIVMPISKGDEELYEPKNLFFFTDPITNCAEFHQYLFDVNGQLLDEIAGIESTAADFAQRQLEMCRKNMGSPDVCDSNYQNATSLNDLPPRVKTNYAFQYAKAQAAQWCGGSGMMCDKAKEALTEAKNAFVSSVLRGDQPVADGILQNAMNLSQFRSGVRSALSDLGEETAGIFVWFMSAFGGFAAGTYSAILPLIITWGLAIFIVATPFIYLMGLIIPAWSLMVALTPLIGVIYLKSVEITFVLVKGIFSVFQAIIGEGTFSQGRIVGANSDVLAFYDLILGIAYTSTFAISLFLLFGLKNPAGLAQQVGTSADKTAQIDGREALQIAGTVAAAAAAPKKVAAFGKAGLAGGVKMSAAAERAGLISDTTGQNIAGVLGNTGQSIRAESHTRAAQGEAQAEVVSNLSWEDYKARMSGQTKKSEEQADMEAAIHRGNKDAYKPRDAFHYVDGTPQPTSSEPFAETFQSKLEKAARDANIELEGKVDVDKLVGHENAIKYNKGASDAIHGDVKDVSIEGLKGAGLTDNDIKNLSGAGFFGDSDRPGGYVQVVNHPGLSKGPGGSGGGSGGPGGGGSGGGGIKDRIKSSAESNRPNRPKGGGDDNT